MNLKTQTKRNGIFRVIITSIEGADNRGRNIPDIRIEIFILGIIIFDHTFVI